MTQSRWCNNNYFDEDNYDGGRVTSLSENASYPLSNLYKTRSRLYKTSGKFEISSTNCKVYIDSTTYTLTTGTYTAATLITHFNSVTGKTLTRNANGRFQIAGTSMTLNLTSTSNAAWNTLGFLGTADVTGTTHLADERRYSTGEWIKVDLTVPQQVDFVALLPRANEVFDAMNVNIYLQGNNTDVWTNPPVDELLDVSAAGAFAAPTGLNACRYWRVFFDTKILSEISISAAYLGSAFILENTNIAKGFSRSMIDQTRMLISESGSAYGLSLPKTFKITNIRVELATDDDLLDLQQFFYDQGLAEPFFVCVDPSLVTADNLSEVTFYVRSDGDVTIDHVFLGYYNIATNFVEVL